MRRRGLCCVQSTALSVAALAKACPHLQALPQGLPRGLTREMQWTRLRWQTPPYQPSPAKLLKLCCVSSKVPVGKRRQGRTVSKSTIPRMEEAVSPVSTLSSLLGGRLRACARGVMGPGEESNVMCVFRNKFPGESTFLGLLGGGKPLVLMMYVLWQKFLCMHTSCTDSQVVACFWLGHLLCKQDPRRSRRKTGLPGRRLPVQRLPPCTLCLTWSPNNAPLACSAWPYSSEASPDAQHVWWRPCPCGIGAVGMTCPSPTWSGPGRYLPFMGWMRRLAGWVFFPHPAPALPVSLTAFEVSHIVLDLLETSKRVWGRK